MALAAVFPEIDSLPCAKREAAVLEGNGQCYGRQRRPYMRSHIIRTFGGVNKERIAIRHKPGHERFEIAPNIRVSIFLDQQRCGRMANLNRAKSVLQTSAGQFT